jgi:hypothetical protein
MKNTNLLFSKQHVRPEIYRYDAKLFQVQNLKSDEGCPTLAL